MPCHQELQKREAELLAVQEPLSFTPISSALGPIGCGFVVKRRPSHAALIYVNVHERV